MKITNLALIKSIPPLAMLGQLHLPAKTSFNLAKVIRTCDAANAVYEDVRLKLVQQFAKKDGDGKIIEEQDKASGKMIAVFEDRAEFDAQLKVLQEQEVTIDGDRMKLDDLATVNLPANVLAAVDWLIDG